MEEEKHQQTEGIPPDTNGGRPRNMFVSDLLMILNEKLQSFVKLSQSYSNTNDERFYQKKVDIDVCFI